MITCYLYILDIFWKHKKICWLHIQSSSVFKFSKYTLQFKVKMWHIIKSNQNRWICTIVWFPCCLSVCTWTDIHSDTAIKSTPITYKHRINANASTTRKHSLWKKPLQQKLAHNTITVMCPVTMFTCKKIVQGHLLTIYCHNILLHKT